MPRGRSFLVAVLLCSLQACPSEPEPPAEPPAPSAEPPAPPPEPEKPKPPALEEPADPDEACAQIVVVAYQGAKFAAPEVTRDKAAAMVRAAELLVKVKDGADFAELAKAESDAPSSAPRGGVMGTYRKKDWPEVHSVLSAPLFSLKVNQVAAEPVEADYGYVLLRRCKVEKASARHILVRYRGASRADARITRDKEAALALAKELRDKLRQGADFAELAKKSSDDSSAVRGGDLGIQGRGRLALPFEEALFSMKPGEISEPVESEFGFHIIERLPDPGTAAPAEP